MAKFKDISKKRDKKFLILSVASLLVSALLIGPFFKALILLLLAIGVVAFADALFRVRKFNNDILIEMKKASYVLSFTLLTSLIFAISLAYIIFHESFWNIHAFQFAYIFPVIFISFFVGWIFWDIVHKKNFDIIHLLKKTFIFTFILVFSLSMISLTLTNILYVSRQETFSDSFERTMFELDGTVMTNYTKGVPVADYLYSYYGTIKNDAEVGLTQFLVRDDERGICLSGKCIDLVLDEAVYLIEIVVDSAILERNFNLAEKELKFIRSEAYLENFSSLEEYSDYLRLMIDESDLPTKKTYSQKTYDLVNSDFGYSDLEKISSSFSDVTSFAAGGLMSEPSIFEVESPFFDSVSYAVTHLDLTRQLTRLVFNAAIFLREMGTNPPLFVELYNDLDADEPLESKTIRYRLVLNWIESRQSDN